jgi:ferritin-like metal-binding protein YciE
MTVKTMQDLFVETLKDIYYAEKHILKALPSMVKKAAAKQLKDALETHRKETEAQVDRLEKIFEIFDLSPRGKKCEAIEGIIAEAKEHMQDIENPAVLDAGMIGSAQAVEHYEITRYGTLIAWAKQLDKEDAIELLQANLDEEKHADELLSEIAEATVNQKAAA